MKRVLVSFVMAIVLAGSGLPLTASALTPSAHACCRAQGAHHCSESASDGNEVAFTAVCPYHASAINLVRSALASSGVQSQSSLYSYPLPIRRSSIAARRNFLRASGRAPPALI
jgi:hypothetical protein